MALTDNSSKASVTLAFRMTPEESENLQELSDLKFRKKASLAALYVRECIERDLCEARSIKARLQAIEESPNDWISHEEMEAWLKKLLSQSVTKS